ncbi:branched-chain amino acid ABC transporter ATP-binding protein/permease [Streptacidiphilus rugosus]|uniref:branched-chain amino acid ABC transporter ATP-binding protein/permease n=1 Tax=Streptacidiphilus rugosus TaxID=405783 RepID=UPI00055A3945|nr:branched-chain amino acid ABC transporter ATP-binding protein/permease [Streptacidiphilus rugosus]
MNLTSFYLANESLLSNAGIGVLYALSMTVLMRAGVFSLAHCGLGAVGAYTSALLILHAHLPWPLAAAAGAAAAALVGLLLAATVARLRHVYLTIATVAFAEVIRLALVNFGFTGGPVGLGPIPRTVQAPTVWITALAACWVIARLARTRFGVSAESLGADEPAARAQGVDVAATRIRLFALSGALAGTAGALGALHDYHIDPGNYTLQQTLAVVMCAVVGGTRRVTGTVLGTVAITLIPQGLIDLGVGAGWISVALQGAILVLVVLFLPQGLGGLLPRRAPAPVAEPLPAAPARPVALDIEDVSLSFGGVKALTGVTLHAAPGEVLGLIGPNGAGKTTLINVITGQYRPDRGSVHLGGQEITGEPVHRIARRGIGRTFQNLRVFADQTCRDNVTAGAVTTLPATAWHRILALPKGRRVDRDLAARAAGLLGRAGLPGRDTALAGALAYGDQRRLEMARAAAASPGLLILDEPAAGMNESEALQLADTIREHAAQGHTVLVVEHNMAMIRRACDRVLVLASGAPLAEGTPDEVVNDPRVIEAYLGA